MDYFGSDEFLLNIVDEESKLNAIFRFNESLFPSLY